MDEITPDQEIDLRGEVCPYTFVKTKLALEMMHPGIGQEGNVSAFQEIAREIKCFLDTSHDPVGVQILEGTERAGVPAAPRRFCILEREDLAGAEYTFLSLLCQGVRVLCGFQDDELVVGIPWDLFLTLPGEMARRASVRATP